MKKILICFLLLIIILSILNCDNRSTKDSVSNILPKHMPNYSRVEKEANNGNPIISNKEKPIIPEYLTQEQELVLISEISEMPQGLLTKLVDNFNQSHDMIKVRLLFSSSIKRLHLNPFSVSDKALDGYADVLLSGITSFEEWVDMGYLESMDVFGIDIDRFFGNAFINVYMNDLIYGLPFFAHKLQLLYYNKQYVESLPPTLDQTQGSIIEDLPIEFYRFIYPFEVPLHLIPFLYDNGFGEVESIEDMIHSINKSIDDIKVFKSSLPEYEIDSSYDYSDFLFSEGKMAYMVNGDWSLRYYKSKLGDNLGVATVPAFTKGGANPGYFAELKYFYVSGLVEDGEKLLAIKSFLEYMTGMETQVNLMKNSTLTSTIKSIVNSNNLSTDELSRTKSFSNSVVFYNDSYKETVFRIIERYVIPLLREENRRLSIDMIKERDLEEVRTIILNEQ
jgi:maltose-binding protein MalE